MLCDYKLLSHLQSSYNGSTYHNLISLQPPRSTRSSPVVTLSRPTTISSLKITDRSLWTPAQRKRASMLYFANVFYLFIYLFYGRLILRPWLTEVRESFTRGGP